MASRFRDRTDAGQRLAAELRAYVDRAGVTAGQLRAVEEQERRELERRDRRHAAQRRVGARVDRGG